MQRTQVDLLGFGVCLNAVERRNRIRLTMAAYGYEIANHPIMSDGEYDRLAYSIDKDRPTTENYHHVEYYGNCLILDRFFKEHFDPSTGLWIYKHPFLNEVGFKFDRLYKN